MEQQSKYDVIIIGAGLTGLTTALECVKNGLHVAIVEKDYRVGGQIQTKNENGYIFETGPNTGVLSNYEVISLFNQLTSCNAEIAHNEAKCRLIFKNNKLHPLPSGLAGGITTPLFSWSDKFRILLEPFRSKGTDPDESVAGIARRRLGKSFVNYAVDPFISGIYAGNPETLVTRFALPKLYQLEQNYGSFIRGAIRKAKEPKTEQDKLVTKEVFSVEGGLENLTQSIYNELMHNYTENISVYLSAKNACIHHDNNQWSCHFSQQQTTLILQAESVISTVGSYELNELFPFIDKQVLKPVEQLKYAGVIQVSIGIKHQGKYHINAFGALMPGIEKRNVLGILFPTACFSNRTHKDNTLYSIFIGGIKRKDLFLYTDNELEILVRKELHEIIGLPEDYPFELFHISRHEKAIPQYEADSEARYDSIAKIEKQYPGLILAGNICGGIGMPDRIKQGYDNAKRITKYLQS